jgi:anti-sigma B factor antagonist
MTTRSDGFLLARFSGVMDHLTAPMFRAEFLNLLDFGDRCVVLDVAGVPFCDSAGLNALLAARRRAQETGTRLALARPGRQLRQLLQLTGVYELLDVHDTLEAAAAALGR